MKVIIKRRLQLLSVFLVLLASSIMFLSSPAFATTSSIDVNAIDKENSETQALKSDKPVKVSKPDKPTVILTPKEALRQANSPVKKQEIAKQESLSSESRTAKDTAPSSR